MGRLTDYTFPAFGVCQQALLRTGGIGGLQQPWKCHVRRLTESDTEFYIKPVFYIYTVRGDIHTYTNATVHLFTAETLLRSL